MEEWLVKEPCSFLNEEELRNFNRNQILIDFDYIPKDIKENIIKTYESTPKNTKSSLYKYFVTNKFINLLDAIEEF